MKEIDRKGNKLFRIIMLSVWGMMQGLLLLIAIAAAQENVLAEGWYWILLISCLWTCLLLQACYFCPRVFLSEDGVQTRVLFRKRFYPWNRIKQAGILMNHGRGISFNQLVLVKENGSKRKYKDLTFRLRNMGKLLYLPATEESRSYVVKYYGPLDFDLSDGRCESSTVLE